MKSAALLLASIVACARGLAPSKSTVVSPTIAAPRHAVGARVAAAAAAALPLVASAAEEYEYGAVSAPSWILPAGAAVAVLSALLVPLALQGGDDAARELQESSRDSFGKSNDLLKKRK